MVRDLGLPVLVKEVGWGLSQRVARLLRETGVKFWTWPAPAALPGASGGAAATDESSPRGLGIRRLGIPTADSIRETRSAAPDAFVIASGGIRTGVGG